jgi:glycosyltransferase involved in cell wall biosynthesis
MNPPLVSIIVVNFNYGKYIEDCLNSVAAQTYKNIECIVLDNNSSDNSVEIIGRFVCSYKQVGNHDISFVCLNQKENLHQTKGCIAGFRESRGEFVCFLDADDTLHPSFVEAHVVAHLSVRSPIWGFERRYVPKYSERRGRDDDASF